MAKRVEWEHKLDNWVQKTAKESMDVIISKGGSDGWMCYCVAHAGNGAWVIFYRREKAAAVIRKESLDKREEGLAKREQELGVREEIVAKREAGLVEVGPVRVKGGCGL
jgi:hypothetical protein